MKSFIKVKGFVISFTAMSILFGISINSNIKNVQAFDIKNFINEVEAKNYPIKSISDKNDLDISLDYESKDYFDDYGRGIGYYPVINSSQDLSDQILSDIDSKISELNLDINNEIYEPIVKFSVEQKNSYAKILVSIDNPNDNSSDYLEYYLDFSANRQISSQEYLEAENNNNKSNFDSWTDRFNEPLWSELKESKEITMVPLRANAEKFGWKFDLEPQMGQESFKYVLKKDNKKIEVLVDSDLDYDLIINDDLTKSFVRTEKLDRKAELQDNMVYVPSSFLSKYLMSDAELDNKDNNKKDIKSRCGRPHRCKRKYNRSKGEGDINNIDKFNPDFEKKHKKQDESKEINWAPFRPIRPESIIDISEKKIPD